MSQNLFDAQADGREMKAPEIIPIEVGVPCVNVEMSMWKASISKTPLIRSGVFWLSSVIGYLPHQCPGLGRRSHTWASDSSYGPMLYSDV